MRSAAASHTGYVRSNNEDMAVTSADLVAVADGMGGHLGGEVAARTAVEELVEAFLRDRTVSGLVAAVQKANRAIWRRSRIDRKVHGMGTTLTAVARVARAASETEAGGEAPTDDLHLALVNVGDSRAYQFDPVAAADGQRLHRLTEDHSVAEEMVRQGEITPDEAAVHPHRHVLTRVLGMDSEVELDVWDLDAPVGTRLMLCSDGLTDLVPESEIESLLATGDPETCSRELVNRALAHGGIDNVTVIVLDLVDDSPALFDQPVSMLPPRPQVRGEAGEPEAPDEIGFEAESGPADFTQSLPVTAAVDAEPVAPQGQQDSRPPTVTSLAVLPAGAETLPVAMGDGVVPGRGGIAETGEIPRAGNRQTGRTMTVSGRPAAPGTRSGPSFNAADGLGAPGGATVLVPARQLGRPFGDRVFTFRVFLFLVLLVALFGGVFGVVVWYQRSAYFVGLHDSKVSIYQGRPGGLLWFKPQLLETSHVTTKNLLPNSVVEVRHGIAESSLSAARQELVDLGRLSGELGLSSPTTATTPVTTAHGSPPTS